MLCIMSDFKIEITRKVNAAPLLMGITGLMKRTEKNNNTLYNTSTLKEKTSFVAP